MLSLTLAALAALAVAVDSSCQLRTVEPLNKTMKRLEFAGSLSWRDVDMACRKQFPDGFEMLKRDFLHLTDADKALCPGQEVPLGLHQEGNEPIVWTQGYLDEQEEVASNYTARMRGDEGSNGHRVGSLDLATNQWRLADEGTTFTCAICQRAWVSTLWGVSFESPSRAEPFVYEFTCRFVKTGGDNVTVDEAIRRVEELVDEAKIFVESSDPGGSEGTFVRVKASNNFILEMKIFRALGGSYDIESWTDVNSCQTTSSDLFYWYHERIGGLSVESLADFRYATKRCGGSMRPDGGWDAVWDDDVIYWISRTEECKGEDDEDEPNYY